MNVAGIQSAMVGMTLFDMWESAVKKSHHSGKSEGSPLVAAAAQAFESYLQGMETQHTALISALSTYCLTPKGAGAQLITPQQQAPFLALNVMA